MTSATLTSETHDPLAHPDLESMLLRLRRAVDGETEQLYRHKDGGCSTVLPMLRRIGFLLLELGFTVAEEGGVDCHRVERAIAQAYALPER